jgi:hypothetical protein
MRRVHLLFSCLFFLCLSCYGQNKEGQCQLYGFNVRDINIYNEVDGKVIMKIFLPFGIEGAEHVFNIIETRDEWLQIIIPTLHSSSAWIRSGSLCIATRNYYNETISLYKEPNKESKEVGKLHEQQIVFLYGGFETWAFVKGKGKDGIDVEGWLEPDMQCPNPYTTCPTPVIK